MGDGVVWDFGDGITAVVGRDGQVSARQDGEPIPAGRAGTITPPDRLPPAAAAAGDPVGWLPVGLALVVGVAVGRWRRPAD